MRARGFSLVEFMIAMTIGLFLVAGLVYLISETSRSRAEIERSSRQIENGRYAIDRMAEDLRHAGFYGEFFDLPTSGTSFPATGTAAAPCANTIATLPIGMPLGVQAYDGGGSVPSDLATCIDAGDYQPDTDILVVRRASTSTIAKAAAANPPFANQPYIQTTPQEYKLDLGSNTGTFTLTFPANDNATVIDAPLHRYVVRIYFVSKCNVPASGNSDDPCSGSDDGGTPIPTLKMLELGLDKDGNTGFRKLAIAEGIEQLQFDFGIDDSGDGVADRIVQCTPCTTAEFSSVVSVQINLVARNTERSPDYLDDKTYTLGLKGYTTATGDGYRRHAYSTFVRVNNIAMRRE